jgi:hypothetical protein
LKRFNFIIAYISSITKRIYLQVSKKRKKENKKGSFLSIKYARFGISTYCTITQLGKQQELCKFPFWRQVFGTDPD